MATYTHQQQRELDSDPAHDKRPAAVPTVPFEEWMRLELEQQQADDIEMLVDKGWTLDDARAFVGENPREGGHE
jgi:hypothetical protein